MTRLVKGPGSLKVPPAPPNIGVQDVLEHLLALLSLVIVRFFLASM